jgi:hypothetical protein
MSRLDGRCMCGAVSYTSAADPLFTAICHCKDCQRQSGAPFSIVVGVPEEGFELSGELSQHDTVGDDHGLPTHRRFCSACGSPILTVTDAFPGVLIVKAGTLDDTSWLEPQLEIWGSSAQPWVGEVEGRPRLERSPPAPA